MKSPKFFLGLCLCVLCFACKQARRRNPVRVSHPVGDDISTRISRKVYAAERRAIRAYARRSGLSFKATPLDFWYAIVDSSQNRLHERFPQSGAVLSLAYAIRSVSGNPIYGLVKRQVRLNHQGIIYGLNEGVKLLKPGDSAIFLIPSHLAFGFHGDGHAIAPNTPLVIQVKLK